MQKLQYRLTAVLGLQMRCWQVNRSPLKVWAGLQGEKDREKKCSSPVAQGTVQYASAEFLRMLLTLAMSWAEDAHLDNQAWHML